MFGADLLLASCDYCDYGDGDRIHSSCGASWWGGTGVVCDHHGDCFCWLECADDYSEQSVTTDPWAMDCVFVDSGGGNSGFSDYAASASVNMMKRFSQQDWLDAGLSALSESGVGAVTIDALCRRVGKTKGSFYSHFPTMSDFIRQLGERWRQTNTDMLIDASERAKPEERRTVLNQLAMSLDHGLEREFRRLAAGDLSRLRSCMMWMINGSSFWQSLTGPRVYSMTMMRWPWRGLNMRCFWGIRITWRTVTTSSLTAINVSFASLGCSRIVVGENL